MLLSLTIENLILIEKAELLFGNGLHILTGETGSGKSAILAAIRIISGDRGGAELVREGASTAIVEAKLSSYSSELLSEIDSPPPGEPLTIRREIQKSGKSRCFIEEQLVPLHLLRKIVQNEIEIVDQSSTHHLCSSEEPRNLLDTFADLSTDTSVLATSFAEEQTAKKRLQSILAANEQKTEDLERAQNSLKKIEETSWNKEEEEHLNEEHTRLVHAQELIGKVNEISSDLSVRVPQIKRLVHLLENILRFDSSLRPQADSLKEAALELEESERAIRSYRERFEIDPTRLAIVEERIASIEHLKRRFGPTWEEVEKQRKKFVNQIERLNLLEEEIETGKETIGRLEKENQIMANRISEKRKEAGSAFSRRIAEELTSLNLPYAQFEVWIESRPLCAHGIDQIRFLFSANPGLAPIPLEQCASGGELSRLLLAIKTVLSEKVGCACLIFDEIDSNVGGHTAAILGERLKTLSKKGQVICVTHFVQVAQAALHHFGVTKIEREGRAFTNIQKLEGRDREYEYDRMIGKGDSR